MGYLSNSLVNYLALLGWAYDDKTEFFSREDLIKKFSLKKVSKNPAAFDPAKLDHIDGEHFKRLDSMKRVSMVREKLAEAGVLPADFRPAEWGSGDGDEVTRLAFILKEMGNRLKNIKDVPDKLAYFYKDDYPVDDEAATKHLSGAENRGHLESLAERLEALDPFDRTTIEEATRMLAGELGIKAGDLIHPCRTALTGQAVSPDIFSVIHLLGREKSVERLRAAGRG
jgi:glutamyl-tRNA synthetase